MEPTPAPATQLHPSRLRAAMASPSSWIDAVIERVDQDADGALLQLRDLDGGHRSVRCEHLAEDLAQPGAPVALHAVFGVLALDGRFVRAA